MNLKFLNKPALLIGTIFSLCLCGCSGAGGVGSRKKMPEFNNNVGEFSTIQPGYLYSQQINTSTTGFTSGYTSVNFNGHATECMVITLPASADLEILNLLNLYKPIATMLLGQWAKQEEKGVVIDFRSKNPTEEKRAEYLISSDYNPDIPVVLLWNTESASRANAYLAQAMELPGFSVKRINAN